MKRFLTIAAAIALDANAMAQEPTQKPPECKPYPECVLVRSGMVPAAPNTGIQTRKQFDGIMSDKDKAIQGISPLDRSNFKIPSNIGEMSPNKYGGTGIR